MKSVGLALAFLVALAVSSEAKEHSQPFKHLTGGFFALSVPNMAESVQWYSEKLGLSVVLEARHGDIEVTVLEGGGLTVELIRDPAARPRGVPRPDLVHGPYKAGFLVKDFDQTLEELRARGVSIAFGPFPASGNQRANLIIHDNSGNLVQVIGE